MNFFEYQEKAKSKTILLAFLFGLAVCTFVLVMHLVLAAVFWTYMSDSTGRGPSLGGIWGTSALWIPFVVLCIILIGTMYKIHMLKQGGGYIATTLGGRRIDPDSSDLSERRLLNIVEEMAIASGIPVPPVYVLAGESSINAFAAGYEPADAVIAVTDGCLRALSREELQGVVAHEFSHIFNGDMRLNIRTIGILNGILIFTVIGRIILSIRARKSPLPLLGLALLVIGSIGVFFSKIIKFAISRQREYLADASAVQFTRNPMGLAGALKKIGGLPQGSIVKNPHAEELSHLFFANGVSRWFSSLFSTHPPLTERISRLDPSFDGRFLQQTGIADIAAEEETAMIAGFSEFSSAADRLAARGIRIPLNPEGITKTVGIPDHAHLAFSQKILASLPEELINAARRPESAIVLIYSLLLSGDRQIYDKQMEIISGHIDKQNDLASIRKLLDTQTDLSWRLPLVSVATAALTKMTGQQFTLFRETISRLVEIDGNITLFEYIMQRMVIKHISTALSPRRSSKTYYASIKPVLPSYATLTSILAYYGSTDLEKASFAFEMAKVRLGIKEPLKILPRSEANLSGLDRSLNILANASPPIKKQVLEAAVVCVTTDGSVTIEEAELLRCIADSLDCPVPPILPGAAESP